MGAGDSAAMTPTPAITSGPQSDADASTGDTRTMRYTPDVTIVAAWISADTGVGPSMASGSQPYSGICALLPVAPMNSSSVISDTVPNAVSGRGAAADCATAWKSIDPKRTNVSRMPRMNAKSPTR